MSSYWLRKYRILVDKHALRFYTNRTQATAVVFPHMNIEGIHTTVLNERALHVLLLIDRTEFDIGITNRAFDSHQTQYPFFKGRRIEIDIILCIIDETILIHKIRIAFLANYRNDALWEAFLVLTVSNHIYSAWWATAILNKGYLLEDAICAVLIVVTGKDCKYISFLKANRTWHPSIKVWTNKSSQMSRNSRKAEYNNTLRLLLLRQLAIINHLALSYPFSSDLSIFDFTFFQ